MLQNCFKSLSMCHSYSGVTIDRITRRNSFKPKYTTNNMERTMIKDAFEAKGKVLLKGWVHDTRDLKKVRFLTPFMQLFWVIIHSMINLVLLSVMRI